VVAADQFLALCSSGGFPRSLLAEPPVPEVEIAVSAEEAVRTFLARYAVAQVALT
jgi:AefR-like transcriptional repressor, C-terminal domain